MSAIYWIKGRGDYSEAQCYDNGISCITVKEVSQFDYGMQVDFFNEYSSVKLPIQPTEVPYLIFEHLDGAVRHMDFVVLANSEGEAALAMQKHINDLFGAEDITELFAEDEEDEDSWEDEEDEDSWKDEEC